VSARRPKQRRKSAAKAAAKTSAGPPSQRPHAQRRADGRLHLALVTDPASGRERLDLVRPVFAQDWQNRLAAAAANTAYAILRDGKSARSAVQLGKAAMDSTSTLVGGLLSRAPPGAVACQAGCDHCCHQSVGITAPEALTIQAYLVAKRTPAELDLLLERMRAFSRATRGLSSRERVSPHLPCPLLEDHACSVYEVRPLSCRGMNSLDRGLCEQRLYDPETRTAGFEGRLPGHVLVEPIRAFHAISAGLQLALAEHFGLDMRPLDLAWALELLLGEARGPVPAEAGQPSSSPPPRSRLAERWLSGEPALASARGGDASQDASRLGLAGAVLAGAVRL
jgi:Fe-S-cluster containining protein